MATPEQVALLNSILSEPSERSKQKQRGLDYAAAIADYIRSTTAHVKDPEPLARGWIREQWTPAQIRANSGLSSSDFGTALQSGLSQLISSRFEDQLADVLAVAADRPMANFRPQSFTEFSIGAPPAIADEDSLPAIPVAFSASAPAQLKTFGGRMKFSYQVWQNFGQQLLSQIADSVPGLFSLLEKQRLAQVIEAATIPTVAATANGAGIAAGMEALLKQTNSAGMPLLLRASAIVIPASMIYLSDFTAEIFQKLQLKVVVLPFTHAKNFYLVCDPALSSPLQRLTLRNSGAPQIRWNDRLMLEEGVECAVSHSFEFSYRPTAGIVKCLVA